jgi:L-threonylcarbamoyladenylate synthase
VVLALKKPIAASRGQAKLAVRIPASPDLVRLLGAAGPLTATSANRSGEPPLTDPEDVARVFGPRIDLLVDGGETRGGMPSTIVDSTVEPPVLLRAGAFPWPC